ncbi:hypothetical protein Q3G72_018783 [Acer saccharum]|nr:hypothetical protein Q3G72_018783 [Acer saccharum]
MVKRLQDARSWSAVIPHLVQKMLSDRQNEARFVTVLCASDREFKVKEDVKFYIVNLKTQSCDFGLWELSGLPSLPPVKKRKPGRSKKNGKRASKEPRKLKRSGGVKCRGCGELAHILRTCKNNEFGPPTAKKNGVGSSSGTNKKTRLEVEPQVAVVDNSSQTFNQSVPLYLSANIT